MVREDIDHERRDAADLDKRTRIRVAQPVRRGQDPLGLTFLLIQVLLLALDQVHDRARDVRRQSERSAQCARAVTAGARRHRACEDPQVRWPPGANRSMTPMRRESGIPDDASIGAWVR